MKIAVKFLGFACFAAALTACNSKGQLPTEYSSKTGFDYNDPETGFFEVHSVYEGKIPPGTVYISTSSTVKGENGDPVSSPTNNAKRRIGNSGYFMDEFEVSNIDWREYVAWVSGVWAHEPRRILLAMPDETVWRRELAYNEPLVNNYYSHVAYGYYPVVGVTWRQAQEYCAWRTDRINERELITKDIIPFRNLKTINEAIKNNPDSLYAYVFTTSKVGEFLRGIYGDSSSVNLDGVLYDAEFRLPTEAEWEYAAYGIDVVEGSSFEGQTYPWKGDQMRGFDDKKHYGEFYANFMRGRGDQIGIMVNNTPTVPVNFFQPNGYGLYNMAGNVNEWVLDVYRATSNDVVEELNSYRGNVFESDSAYAERILDRLGAMDQQTRDSMRNVLVKEKKFTESGADYRSFRDGDRLAALGDSVLHISDENIAAIERSHMISDQDRIYKGGSWCDRAIWLNPAARRYMNENKCSNDIGFRCAMSSVGGKKN